MLEIGVANMTLYQQQTHFAFWGALKSPLIIGADLTKLSNESLAVLTNKNIIALNQDSLGKPVNYLEAFSEDGLWQVWAGKIQGGYVVLLLNEKSFPQTISLQFSNLELGTPRKIVELWSEKTLNTAVFNGTIQPYQTLVFKIDTA